MLDTAKQSAPFSAKVLASSIAVAVGIGLDDGGDLNIRPDVLAYLAHIMSRCVEVDLGL